MDSFYFFFFSDYNGRYFKSIIRRIWRWHGLKIVKTLEPDSLEFEYYVFKQNMYYDIVFLSSFLPSFLFSLHSFSFLFFFFSSFLPPFLPLFFPFLSFFTFLQKLLCPSTISGNYISEQKHKNCCHLGALVFWRRQIINSKHDKYRNYML